MEALIPERIDWRRVLIEGVVIIVSILLALGAEAWWQERSARVEEAVLLRGLHAEFASNAVSLQAQADSLSTAIGLLESVIGMGLEELTEALAGVRAGEIVDAVNRPRTVEFQVGALEGILGTERASLVRSHELLAELAEYQSLRGELDELGGILRRLSVDALLEFESLPESYTQLIPLLKAKSQYWDAYRFYLGQFVAQAQSVAALIAAQN